MPIFFIMNEQHYLKGIFQQEFAKMVAVISKLYGLQHIEIAEDIVSETFLHAAESWGMKGLPANPVAWLYTVAKQKMLYHFRRSKIFEVNVAPELKHNATIITENDQPDFSEENIRDSQLQMLFAVCDPAVASEAQIGLALRVLCGFGIEEIAEAFLTNKETINKRLYRAKEKLRTEGIKMELPSAYQLQVRLDNVLHVIYLLFNEGYYSRSANGILRKEFCVEAIRLGIMLTEYQLTNAPKTNALMALMCFHASRFDARQNSDDTIVLYDEQDDSMWNRELIDRGIVYLSQSASGPEMSSYHLEARIAYWHCVKADTQMKWEEILSLYNQLLQVNYSPTVALNRLFAIYKAKGVDAALDEVAKLDIEHTHFYFVLLAELYKAKDINKALASLKQALALAKTETERQLIKRKIEELDSLINKDNMILFGMQFNPCRDYLCGLCWV